MRKRHYVLIVLLAMLTISVVVIATWQTATGRYVRTWIRAFRGNELFQLELADIYFVGSGVPADPDRGLYWLHTCAYQGLDNCQGVLGSLYHEGLFINQDSGLALRWYMLAANQGLPWVQQRLGEIYRDGALCPRDLIQAHKWFTLANDPFNDLEALEGKMTSEQIQAAALQVENWKPRVLNPRSFVTRK